VYLGVEDGGSVGGEEARRVEHDQGLLCGGGNSNAVNIVVYERKRYGVENWDFHCCSNRLLIFVSADPLETLIQ
jgi:hypothetical protein